MHLPKTRGFYNYSPKCYLLQNLLTPLLLLLLPSKTKVWFPCLLTACPRDVPWPGHLLPFAFSRPAAQSVLHRYRGWSSCPGFSYHTCELSSGALHYALLPLSSESELSWIFRYILVTVNFSGMGLRYLSHCLHTLLLLCKFMGKRGIRVNGSAQFTQSNFHVLYNNQCARDKHSMEPLLHLGADIRAEPRPSYSPMWFHNKSNTNSR